ncbi:hypothetical protein [Aquimonas voraii]|uniref:VCBS repeat-containing protein n=1 Tax=Aquimonas voraii TaxID=265719 RepID=A0A1G6UXN0_9GAMM|nr:hypothetical protein [Aquimonas voraii]SDD46048.1 hypothetical protein SAMN04488509_102542 [Aquimonas voraii]
MRIVATELQLASAREFRQTETREERLDLRIGPSPAQARPEVELSARGRELALQVGAGESPLLAPEEVAATDEAGARNDPNLSLLIRLIETLTGRPVKLFDASQLNASGGTDSTQPAASASASPPPAPAESDPGFSLDYQYRATRSEYERTSVSAQGEVLTADGARIRFSLDLSMERAYSETVELRLQAGAAAQRKDPLVINFDGRAAQLSDQRFAFDLDADGQTEALPMLRSGSGFLAFDRNVDGRVNDGSELFGAKTGDGFGELLAFDSDGNGWIDSGDTIFGRLRVWMPDPTAPETGKRSREEEERRNGSQLLTLEEAGVAAISLRPISSAFELRGANNSDLGQVRSTSLYLSTAATAGVVQQIDLSV